MLRKLILSSLFLSSFSFAAENIKESVEYEQKNIQGVIRIAEHCRFTGIDRRLSEVELFVDCRGLSKSMLVKDEGLIKSFYFEERHSRDELIEIDVYKTNDVNFETLKSVLEIEKRF